MLIHLQNDEEQIGGKGVSLPYVSSLSASKGAVEKTLFKTQLEISRDMFIKCVNPLDKRWFKAKSRKCMEAD